VGFNEICKGVCNVSKYFIAEPFSDLSTGEIGKTNRLFLFKPKTQMFRTDPYHQNLSSSSD